MKTIVYATDFSSAGEYALPVAQTLAGDLGAKLLIVHVSQSEIAPVGELFDEEPEPPTEELARLQRIIPTDPQITYEHRLVYGEPGSVAVTDPAEELAKLAQQEDADMIVIGLHVRSGLSRLLMRNVAESLVERAPCPVLTVRKSDRQHETPAEQTA
jgi:universal stress protein A